MHPTSHYRGIALFGPRGSGKTSVATELKKLIPTLTYIETSKSIIQPLTGKQLPHTIQEAIAPLPASDQPVTSPREELLETYVKLQKTYGLDAVSQIITNLKTAPLLISGNRGLENAAYLLKNNYLVVYLDGPSEVLQQRAATRDNKPVTTAALEAENEEILYHTTEIASIATITFDTTSFPVSFIAKRIADTFQATECRVCLNTNLNPVTPIGNDGLCPVCHQYKTHFKKSTLKTDLKTLLNFRGKSTHDVMVGLSGGKDSSVTTFLLKELGFNPLAFTFDLGYYPEHIFSRATEVAKKLDVPHEIIDIHPYISESGRHSYQESADLYDRPNSPELADTFLEKYQENRSHYSAKDNIEQPFVRSCQLCRKVVIPAYYGEAVKRGISLVVLGINEWAGLSQDAASDTYSFSGIRILKPFPDQPPVTIAHLPFILGITKADIERITSEIGWVAPDGEGLIESNSNSCLFARAAEEKAHQLLGFHPDITRLSREITTGFIDKETARAALAKHHPYPHTVRETLEKAHIL